MNRSAVKENRPKVVFQQWRFKQAVALEQQKQELQEEKRKFEEERRGFDLEKREFTLQKRLEGEQLERQKQLFQMKWKILEGELKKLADEKQQIEKQRDFYRFVSEHENRTPSHAIEDFELAEAFFVGVANENSLKRRYKDLLKIYHPDNIAGDTGVLQLINREYAKLKEAYQ